MKPKKRKKIVSDGEGVLKDEVVREIEKARRDFKKGKGKYYTLEEVKKRLGLK